MRISIFRVIFLSSFGLVIILIKSLGFYLMLYNLVDRMSNSHLVDLGSIPLHAKIFFIFQFFSLDLAKISQKSEVEIRDARTFFE